MSKSLIVVDAQNDFCEGGSLAVPGGKMVCESIAAMLGDPNLFDEYTTVLFSQDWHNPPPDTNGGHFALSVQAGAFNLEDADYKTTWPVHCVANTHGSDFYPPIVSWLVKNLEQLADPHGNTYIARKGQGKPAYSAFEGMLFPTYKSHVSGLFYFEDEVDIVGLAYDHCVAATAIDARKEVTKRGDLTVNVLSEYTASVSRESEIAATIAMHQHGVNIK